MTLTMQINGRGKMHSVATYEDASRLMQSEQQRLGYGGPDDRQFPRQAMVFANGAIVAHVSQNGRVWAGADWTSSTPLICERA